MIGPHDLAAGLLRRLEPERAHELTLAALEAGLGPKFDPASDAILSTELAGLRLPNPIGLAAGFDKNARAPDALLRMGFGLVECGSVTPRSQAGNPRPRLFRLPQDRAVINRMGFNNQGLEPFALRLAARPRRGVVGANIGANKDSEDRVNDYVAGLRRLWGLADYFVINVSSPNTPGLRELQGRGALADLLGAVSAVRRDLPLAGAAPIFLKIAPELTLPHLEAIVESAVDHGLAGLIVSNTTAERPTGLSSPHREQAGGLSGRPLMARSTRLLSEAFAAARGRLSLIGVGGVSSGAEAYAKIRAGAEAVQLYTALVYDGPGLVSRIQRDLAARLRADGFSRLEDAVGAS